MKTPVVLMALTLTALLRSQSGIASNVGSPAYRPDGLSILLDLSPKNPVEFDGSSKEKKPSFDATIKSVQKGTRTATTDSRFRTPAGLWACAACNILQTHTGYRPQAS